MFLNITDGKNKDKGGNKGSCGQLVHYLEKENRLFRSADHEPWFNSLGAGYEPIQIRNRMDQNKTKLGQHAAKFFLLNISPSQKEIAHLKALYGEQGAKDQLKAYAIKVMDEYARNFKRKGINGNKDLLWFAKLENHRYYSYKDKQVKNGTAKRGELKPGEQMHIQVIVSRKDVTNKIKLSPENNSDGKNKAHSQRMGEFNRVAFKASGERIFDELFGFVRPVTETFKYSNAQVNGGLGERIALTGIKRKEQQVTENLSLKIEVSGLPTQKTDTLLDLLLAKPDFDPAPAQRKKKKRRKTTMQQPELTF